MGALYTDTYNAIRWSERIVGLTGKPGFRGITGPRGNRAVYLPYDPTSSTYAVGIANGSIIPKDVTGAGFPSTLGGSWPNVGDKFINSLTGVVYYWNSSGVWVLSTSPSVKGNRGPGNYVKSEVSFNSEEDNQGFIVDIPNAKTLVGHIIYPGKSVAGNMNKVQVLVQASSDSKQMNATAYLVNLGTLVAGNDDIVIARSTTNISGKGDNTSWFILDLAINNNNVPNTQEVLGLFIFLSADKVQQKAHIENLKRIYSPEAASLYTTNMAQTEITTKESFYKVLSDNYNTTTIAETPADFNLRVATEEAALVKKALISTDLKQRISLEKSQSDIPYDPFLGKGPSPIGIKDTSDPLGLPPAPAGPNTGPILPGGSLSADKGDPWESTPVTYTTKIKVAHLLIS